MALSEANQNKVCQILQVTPSDLEYQLTLLSTDFTAQRQTDVEAQITLWDAGAATNFTSIEPKERNFGARINPNDSRNSIRRNIAVLLERPDWAASMSGSRLVRC